MSATSCRRVRQLTTLPWIGIDRVSIRFSDNVGSAVGQLTLAGVNTPPTRWVR